jgi:hypothetical protein
MPLLRSETSIGDQLNWRLDCENKAILEAYWTLFQDVYSGEMEFGGNVPDHFYSIDQVGGGGRPYYTVLFRTRGNPSFYAAFVGA